jgi:hypothetical protein
MYVVGGRGCSCIENFKNVQMPEVWPSSDFSVRSLVLTFLGIPSLTGTGTPSTCTVESTVQVHVLYCVVFWRDKRTAQHPIPQSFGGFSAFCD